jgi:hypothetical protein
VPNCLLPLQRRDVVEVFNPESLGDTVDDLLASVGLGIFGRGTRTAGLDER